MVALLPADAAHQQRGVLVGERGERISRVVLLLAGAVDS
jgi:hypothetical protein